MVSDVSETFKIRFRSGIVPDTLLSAYARVAVLLAAESRCESFARLHWNDSRTELYGGLNSYSCRR